MNDANQTRIFEACPIIYRGRHEAGNLVGMFGIEVGDGWFDIVFELSVGLEELAKRQEKPLMIRQIKEKFGSLCVYSGHLTGEARSLILAAEKASVTTCEACGSVGGIERRDRFRTICGPCASEKQSEMC